MDENMSNVSNTLKYNSVQIFNRHICRERYRRAWQIITEKMLCAMASGTDTCQGDSGTPLICNVNGSYYVTGITSWGIDCASNYYPGVYTDVFTFRSWILLNNGSKNNVSFFKVFLFLAIEYIITL
ncbi:putative serine protease 29 [Chrysoperla carnea]|uniref:putative serine protease 29 n=1 Tax=Chrysoperla carnea TaxID=189513 RepID=UPI001D0647EB|nr:putative serine protease 29 [Chrysoperla carnea]